MTKMKMARVLMLAVLGLGLATLTAGCGSASQGPIQLTAKDSGSNQTLAVGQELRIALDSNPTTGYMWSVDGAIPEQLSQTGDSEFKETSAAIGAGGIETWSFKAKSTGEGRLKLKYWRSFEPTAAPAQTFDIGVTVK
jgi:inhibitor of cysteine peptidase